MTENNNIAAFEGCYIMQPDDIKAFADTLADGFSEYNLFQYALSQEYDHAKMSLFWEVSIRLLGDNAIGIADSPEANSVLIYVRPKSKEPGLMSYLLGGGLKLPLKLGLRSALRLHRFNVTAQAIARRHKGDNDGYMLAFATRLDKQGQRYGKPVLEALLRYLDHTGEGCYLETLNASNVELYRRFGFELREEVTIKLGNLTNYAMSRVAK